MSRLRMVLPLALLLALAPAALALLSTYDREEVGPHKDARAAPGADPDVTFRLSPHRRYWREWGFSGFDTFRDAVLAGYSGDVDAANAALTTFAALPPGKKEVWLFPAPGRVHSKDGKSSHQCDWTVHWARHPQSKKQTMFYTSILTLFVARTGTIPPADPRAARWVKELDDDSYPVREAATLALEALGDAALPALREGLEKAPAPELRRRVKRLLDRLGPIHLGRVKLPRDIPVVPLDRLVAEELKNWRSGDPGRSYYAAEHLAAWAEYTEDALPPLVEGLRDQRQYVRELAAAAFARLGKCAEGVLAQLKAAAGPESRDDVREAIRSVTGATAEPGGAGYWKENRRLRAAIEEFCRAGAPGGTSGTR